MATSENTSNEALSYLDAKINESPQTRHLLTCEAKVVCFLKIGWRFNEALLNYLEVIIIGMKPTLIKERRFDGVHVDQSWNVCSPYSYIIKKVYLKFVINIVDLVALIRCIWS